MLVSVLAIFSGSRYKSAWEPNLAAVASPVDARVLRDIRRITLPKALVPTFYLRALKKPGPRHCGGELSI